ncbi:MAG: hypothetical protein AAFY99_01270 [Pseudomonadota bacterium]
MQLPRLTLLVLSFLSAPVALAACPTAADMVNGVEVMTDYGNVEVHRRAGNDRVQVEVTFEGGTEGSLLDFLHGIYLMSAIPMENGKALTGEAQNFGEMSDAIAWQAPAPNAQWVTEGLGAASITAGEPETFQIGSCSLAAYEVKLDYEGEDYQEVYMVLQDLGIGLMTQSTLDTDVENTSYVSIKAVE